MAARRACAAISEAADHRIPSRGSPSSDRQWIAAFVQRLHELGRIEGSTVAIEYCSAEGRIERYTEIATEFVQMRVDVIVTAGTAAVRAAKQATSVIPIVFAAAGDPVGSGLVASLARPGGNVTGLSLQFTDLTNKRLELLREVLPHLSRLGILANAGSPSALLEMHEAEATARTLGIEVVTPDVQRIEDIAARLRSVQRPRGCRFCYFRSTRKHRPGSHQHTDARRANADDGRWPGAC